MLNPSLTPPRRDWPLGLRVILVTVALAYLGWALRHVLDARSADGVLQAAGQSTFLAERKVSAGLWSIAVVAYVCTICAAAGLDLIVRNFKGTLAPVVAFPVHLALGLGLFSVLFFLLGIAPGGYKLWCLVAVLLAGGINVIRWHRYRHAEPGRRFDNPPETALWYFMVVALTIVAMAAALAPATAHDDLVYHLENPSHMLQAERIDAPEWNLCSHLPNMLHFLYVPMLGLDTAEAAPRLLTVFLGVMIAYCLYRIGCLWWTPRAGGVAGLLFLTCPVVLDAWPMAGLDIAGAFFITVAMLILVAAPMDRAYPHARLAGVIAGCGLACRLSAVSALAGLLVLLAARWWSYRRGARDTIGLDRPNLPRLLTAFLWPLVAVMTPFAIRAWVETGNPIYPFLFGGPGITPQISEGAGAWYQSMGMGDGFGDFVRLPWRLVARGAAGVYGRFDGVVQPWLLLLVPVVLGAPRHWGKVLMLLLMLAASGAVWFVTSQQARFLIPVLPWAALIAGLGFETFVRGFQPRQRPWVSGALGLLVVGTGVFLVPPRDVVRFSENVQVALTHRDSRADYLRRNLEVYPALEWLNGRAALDAHGVVMLWENRGHHLEVPWVADPILEVPHILLEDWRGESPAAIARWMRDRDLSHVLFRSDAPEIVYREGRYMALDRVTHDTIWRSLAEAQLTLVHEVGAYQIYRLNPPGR